MPDNKTFVDNQMDAGYESLQIAKMLLEHFKDDYNNMTRDSDPDVKIRSFGLFVQSLTISVNNCYV